MTSWQARSTERRANRVSRHGLHYLEPASEQYHHARAYLARGVATERCARQVFVHPVFILVAHIFLSGTLHNTTHSRTVHLDQGVDSLST